MSRRSLHIHIDRVVVDGLPPLERQRFVRSLEQQLEQMAGGGLIDAAGHARRIGRVDGGQMRRGATAESAAGQVANAVRTAIAGKGAARG